jgi:methylglyoxal/glyoxal reductase
MEKISDAVQLNNGVDMPWLGLGVWQTKEGGEVVSAVKAAIGSEYRSIDTASAYRNEEGVGKGIKESGVNRADLFVTTKVWNGDQGYDQTIQAFEASRAKLGLEYIDLYLIHWPVKGKYNATWKALERLYDEGLVRAIGVSNFQQHHLEDVLGSGNVSPAVNQVEFHPLLQQLKLREFCKQNRIQLEAWSPLMQGHLDLPVLKRLAEKYGKSPAQIVLRWDLQKQVVTIPKSIRAERIHENASIFDFTLNEEDVALIDGLNEDRRFGPDPDNFNF